MTIKLLKNWLPAAVLALSCATIGAAHAANITVTGNGDTVAVDGLVTLREAIQSANTDAAANADVVAQGAYGADTIVFDSTFFGTAKTITVDKALPQIKTALTITGPAAGVTVDGSAQTFSIFDVDGSASVGIDTLTISHGNYGINITGTPTVTVSNCTITAAQSGIIQGRSSSALTLSNSTVSNNVVIGIIGFPGSTTNIMNSTVSGNGTQGINHGNATTLQNSLVVGNGVNIVSVPVGSINSDAYSIGSGTAADVKLGPLQNNGGPTPTMALLADSPAINAGNPGFDGTGKFDQRGAGYDRVRQGRLDLGAYESDLLPPTPIPATQNGPDFVVNSIADTDDGACDIAGTRDGCTLREAVKAANKNLDVSTITFDLPGNGPHTIELLNVLPDITTSINFNNAGAAAEAVTIARSSAMGTPRFRLLRVSNNTQVGPVVTLSYLTLTNGDTNSGGGGGIETRASTVTINNCTLSNNSAVFGGAINNTGSLSVNNSTISGNTAFGGGGADGGGVVDNYSGGSVSFSSCTLTNNTAPNIPGGGRDGIWLEDGTVTLSNTIASGNGVQDIQIDTGSASSGGHNLIGVSNVTSFNATGDQNGVTDLQLGDLADNGGLTQTHALQGENPAINAGPPTGAPAEDQRGYARNGVADIGAFEFGGIAPNTPPTLEDVPITTDEDTAFTFAEDTFDSGFSDAQFDILQKVKIVSLPASGVLTLNGVAVEAEDEIAREDLHTLVYTPDANFNGDDSFGYNAFDGTVYAAEGADVKITVTPVAEKAIAIVKLTNGTDNNTAPGPSIPVGSTVTFTYLVTNPGEVPLSEITVIDDNGTPANTDDDFYPTYVGGDANANSQLETTETWTLTGSRIATAGQYTNIGTATGTPESGLAVTATDSDNHFGGAANTAPVATDTTVSTDEDTELEIDLADLVSDAETADAGLAYFLDDEPPAEEGTVELVGSKVTFTPAENFAGETSFTYYVTDEGDLDSATKKVTINVTSENDAPVLDPIGDKNATEGVQLAFTAEADDAEDNLLTFSLVGAPAGAAITSGGNFTWTPSEAQGPGSFTFKVRVSDGDKTDEEEIEVTVAETNSAPVLPFVGARTLKYGSTTTFNFAATDADLPKNALTYSLVGAPTGASINPTTGVFSWTPTAAQANVNANFFSFKIKVTDDGTPSLSDEETAAFTVAYPVDISVNTTNPSLKANNVSQSVTFTYTVRNNSNVAYTNLQVKGDVFWPSTLQSVVLTPSTGTTGQVFALTNTSKWVQWTIPSLPAGTSKTISVKLTGVVPTNAPAKSKIASGWTLSSVTAGVIPSMSAPEVFLNTYK